MYKTVNPYSEETIKEFNTHSNTEMEDVLASLAAASPQWANRPLDERTAIVRQAGKVLLERRDELAHLISQEMGKLVAEARAEVEKCARTCDYYADHAAEFLADEPRESDADKSAVIYQPLGTVFAIMPWNFPLWQVFRFAIPAMCAGNTALLKHAPNVPQCAQAIADVWREAGAPEGVFCNLYLTNEQAAKVIADDRVHAVTLTGSGGAGRAVAAEAGKSLKKCVLELGGSDAFVVLDDADLDLALAQGMKSRFQNAGQSCIAAKRFIVTDKIADDFIGRLAQEASQRKPGNPADESTTLAPMARGDLREGVAAQVQDALDKGATAPAGGAAVEGNGYFYQATVLDGVKPGMRAWDEELFGPVAVVIRVKDEKEALAVANGVPFGLGGSVWTRDIKRGEAFARKMQCGAAFVNGMVKSDPRLPFGGIKNSGYGRELAAEGMREFVNVKSLWVSNGG